MLLAFGFNKTTVNGQQTTDFVHKRATDNSQQTLCTSDAYSRTVDRCPLSVDYYESQIRKADSLYKNYLPQYNFDEVKAAMEFFDSLRLSKTTDNSQRTTDFFHRIFSNRKQKDLCTVPEPVEGTTFGASTSSATSLPRTVDRCPLSVDFNCARAHYYHAVGLTEHDDIVGACEHYLIALDIMENIMANDKRLKVKVKKSVDCCPLSVDNTEDYEKIRFVSLIYTRLGELFYDNNHCDLSIENYNSALKFVRYLGNKETESVIFKYIGNSYQLSNKDDSALFYYTQSINLSHNPINKIDIEKNIAQILFKKGERDSAYRIMRLNLERIDNYIQKESYYVTLGEMYYKDKIYDTAVIYLKLSLNSSSDNIILTSSNYLSNIYELLNDAESKKFYDNISITYFSRNSNRSVNVSKLPNIYNNHIEKKREIERIRENRIHSTYFLLTLCVMIFLSIIIFLIMYYNKKKLSEQKSEIDTKDKTIEEITKDNDNLRNQNEELIRIKIKHEKTNKNCIKSYRECDNSKKILSYINNIKNENLKINNLNPLSNEELTKLLDDADIHLENYIQKLSNKYPKLKKEDFYCICLLLLNISEPTIAALLGKSYNTIWSRINKIRSILGVNSNINLTNIIK